MLIDNYFELLALHKSLLEAKFSDSTNDYDVPLSPMVASLASRVIDEIVAQLKMQNKLDEVDQWENWRTSFMARSREVSIVKGYLKHISSSGLWGDFSENDKSETVKDLVAPFLINDEDLASFVNYTDRLKELKQK